MAGFLYTASTPLSKAFLDAHGDSTAREFGTDAKQLGVPPSGAGVHKAGAGSGASFNRLKFWPYCKGPAGTTFSARVYGWHCTADEDARKVVWVGSPLAEFLCVAGDAPGPAGGHEVQATYGGQVPHRFVPADRNFCDQIALTWGSLGYGMFAGHVRAGWPGYAGYATLDIDGAQMIQFEFTSEAGNVPMNALWARA